MVTRSNWRTANTKDRRGLSLVQEEIRKTEEETRQVKAVEITKQGQWTNWEGTRPRHLMLGEIWSIEEYRLSFLLRSVYDMLPTAENLNRWGLREEPACSLCPGIGSLEHVLSACPASSANKWSLYMA
jgi:hypothetical protein